MVLRSPLRRTAATVTDVLAVIDDQPHVADALPTGPMRSLAGAGLAASVSPLGSAQPASMIRCSAGNRPAAGIRNARTGGARRRREHRAQRLAPPAATSPVANALPPVSAARFYGRRACERQLRYLASIDSAIGRIHAGEFYQLNLCTRLVSESADGAAVLFARLAASSIRRTASC